MLLPHHPPVLGRVKASPLQRQLFCSPQREQLPGAAAGASQDFYVQSSKPDEPPPAVGPAASSSRAGAGGVSAPAPRAHGSGRCRCIRGGPNCSIPGAPPVRTCLWNHPWREEEGKPEPLRALKGSETSGAPFSSQGWVLQGQSTYLQVKRLDGVAVMVIGELPQEKALLLSLLLQALRKGREAERENQG